MPTPNAQGATWLHRFDSKARCAVIGEVAQAHDGSLGLAHAHIDAIADAGGDAVKFQTHIAAAESTPREPWRIPFSPQDESRFAYWRRLEFSADQWRGLKRHCDQRGLVFLSSPFSTEAATLLESLDIAAWKVASGEITNAPLMAQLAASKRPVILSTGMSPLAEIDAAVAGFQANKTPLAVLQCTSRYPCPLEAVGLNNLALFKERYGCAVGLSDHSATPWPGVAAAQLGAQVIEVHVTLSRRMYGPDVSSSLTVEDFARLVEGVRAVETLMANPVDKTQLDAERQALRHTFMKSVVAARDLAPGTVLTAADLALKKPGGGLAATDLEALLGRRLVRGVVVDQPLAWDDVAVEVAS